MINRLIRTATDLGAPGRDDRYGFGLVDPLAAVTAEVADVPGEPAHVGAAADPAGIRRVGTAAAPAHRTASGPAGAGTAGRRAVRDVRGDRPGRRPRRGTGARARSRTPARPGPSLLVLLLLAAAVLASLGGRREYLKRYLAGARHSR